MKILHVISGISPTSGGPTRSVKGLCRALSRNGVNVTLLVLRGNDVFENPCGVEVCYGRVPDVGCYDIVHMHGIWNPKFHSVVKACRKTGVKYVISPRGMLDPWALSVKKWKKIVALFLWQRRDLRYASAFHVTAKEEFEHVRAAGFQQPCIVAPNAVDLPEKMPDRSSGSAIKTAIFLSRLHPGKGLLTLAEAWAKVNPPGWRMLVIGPDSYGHKKDVLSRLCKLGVRDQWEFHDAVTDDEKWKEYRAADLLVHPSVSENFGITIAEGLAAGLPVITTKGTPWRELDACKCGWWIDIGVEPLVMALKEATALSDAERRDMGERGRSLVRERYTWDAVEKAMVKGYEDILR